VNFAACAVVPVARPSLHRLETGGDIHLSETKRQGHVRRSVWQQITAALAAAGVELVLQGTSYGAGVRWTAPRESQRIAKK